MVPWGLPPSPRPSQRGADVPRCSAPHRALQHTNLLQCLAQCAEVTPYLLVMEFCPLVSAVRALCAVLLPTVLRRGL